MRKRIKGTEDERVTKVAEITVDPDERNVDEKLIPVQPFPMEIFPTEFQEFVNYVAAAKNMEPGVVASIALTALSGAVGNTLRFKAWHGYQTVPFLWLVVIAESGEGKTPASRILLKHVKDLQTNAKYEHDQIHKEEKGGGRDKKAFTRYWTDDHTLAGLEKIYMNNPRGVILDVDEISGWILGLNDVSRARYLRLFDGDSWMIDRYNRSTLIPNTGAAVAGAITPKKLPSVFTQESFDEGLFPRFLVYPTDVSFSEISKTVISDEKMAYWTELLDNCYGIPLRAEKNVVQPKGLTFNDEAAEEWTSWFNEKRGMKRFISERARVFTNKLYGTYSLKFAGMLHTLDVFTLQIFKKRGLLGRQINKEMVQKAILLTDFFAGQAIKMLKSYDNKASILNEFEKELIMTLFDLKDAVTPMGKLNLGKITDAYNSKMVTYKMNFKNKGIGSMLRRLGLETKPGTAHKTDLLWEPKKIEKIFSELKLTKLTKLISQAQDSSENDEATEKRTHIPVARKKPTARKRLDTDDEDN